MGLSRRSVLGGGGADLIRLHREPALAAPAHGLDGGSTLFACYNTGEHLGDHIGPKEHPGGSCQRQLC